MYIQLNCNHKDWEPIKTTKTVVDRQELIEKVLKNIAELKDGIRKLQTINQLLRG